MDELEQYWNILRRRWLPASTICGVVLALTAWITFQQQPIYEAKGKVLLKRTNSTASLTGLGKQISELESVGGTNPTNTQAEILRSIPVVQETIAALKLSQKPDDFIKSLNVTNIKATDILDVAYKDTNPQKAAAIVNQLMQVYVKSDVNAQRAEAQGAREFVEKQLPLTETNVRQAEEAMRLFKRQNHIVDLQAEAKATVEVLRTLAQDITASQAELATQTARVHSFQQIFGLPARETAVTGFFGESPTTQKVLTDLQQVQQKLALERIRFQEDHPVIVDLRTQEATLKNLLERRLEESVIGEQPIPKKVVEIKQLGVQQRLIQDFANAEAERASVQQRIVALSKVEAAYKERINVLPTLEKQQRELERQLEAAQSTYKLLLEKLQEIRVAENQNVGNVRIVAPALVPEQPIAPRKAANLAMGGLAGILLALVTALILEAIDKSIKSTQAARDILGYPLLGMIPAFRDRHHKPLIPEVMVRDDPGSSASEAFRMLQTNLRFLSSDKTVKVIVVSSSVTHEGKSTVAANLAAATAQLHRRVLLIDGDMRHPVQHQIWRISNEVGLSSTLLGQSDFSKAITEVMPDLAVLPAGVSTPNPVTLIDSSQMALLISHCSQNYDFVIIDSPPLTSATDATLLGKMTDGVLLVVRPEIADATSVTFSKELLQQSSQQVLGLVINGINTETKLYSYSKYGAEV